MFQIKKRNIDVRANWVIFKRRKYYFLIPFIICITAGVIISYATTPVYQSSTIIRVSHNEMLSGAIQRLVPGITPRERLDNLRRLITSHAYLKRLCETLKLVEDAEMRKKAENDKVQFPGLNIDEIAEALWISRLKRFLSVQQLGTDFIEINALGNTPDLAYNFAKALTQIFIDESLRREVGGIRGAREFSTEQTELYKKRLEQSEERLRKFKEEIVRDEFENRTVISANMEQVNSKLAATDFELREAIDRLQFIESQLNELNIYYSHPNNRSLNRIKKQLLETNQQLSTLMLKYTWHDAKVLKLNSEIENLRKRFKEEVKAELESQNRIDNKTYLDIAVQKEITATNIEFLERKKNTLTNLVGIYKSIVTKAPAKEMTLNRLQREVESTRQIYRALMDETRGSEIKEALQRTAAEFKFEIVEPPIRPLEPIKPNRQKIMMMAVVFGIVIGLSLIFILEYLDDSFKSVEDVEKYLNLYVLGVVSKIERETTDVF